HQFFYVRLVDLFDFLFRRLLCSIYVDVIYLKFLSGFKIYFDYYVRLGNKVNNIDDYYFDYLWCEDYKYIKVIFSDYRETSASQPRLVSIDLNCLLVPLLAKTISSLIF
ncbi:hypothetical protein ES319_D03G065600v1, partial [Gossypium barbadense]